MLSSSAVACDFIEEIIGMPEPEALALLDELLEHAAQEKFQYRHKWKGGHRRDLGQSLSVAQGERRLSGKRGALPVPAYAPGQTAGLIP